MTVGGNRIQIIAGGGQKLSRSKCMHTVHGTIGFVRVCSSAGWRGGRNIAHHFAPIPAVTTKVVTTLLAIM